MTSIQITKYLSGNSPFIDILTSVSSLYQIVLCNVVSIVRLSISVRGILGSVQLAPFFLGAVFLVAGILAPFFSSISVLRGFVLSLPVNGRTPSAFSYSNESIATTGIFGSVRSFILVSSRYGIVNHPSKFLLVYFQSLICVIFLLDLTSKILLDFFTGDYSRTFYQ